MAKKGSQEATDSSNSSHDQRDQNRLQLPPSQSSLSVRSENDDGSTGYITASSSRVSQLDTEPVTALPRVHLESLQSSTPVKRSSSLAKSPSSDSITTTAGSSTTSSNRTSRAKLASLSSVTTFIPSTLDHLDTSDEDDNAFSDRDRLGQESNDTDDLYQKYDFDLRDPHERTLLRQRDDHDEADQDATDHEQTLTIREGDVITVSHSHSTSINTYNNDSVLHSRSASQTGSTSHRDESSHSHFPLSLSASWPSMPSLALPPSAIKMHKRRRNIVLRLLKTWEGREQVLQFSHSLILLLYSSLDHPVPQTYRGALLRPAGTVLAMSFPKPVRVALMQRIYTSAEGVDNFRRVILIARWVTSATEAVMDHWQQRQANKRLAKKRASREELEIKLTGEEPLDKKSDHIEGGFRWLQPPSIEPFDAANGCEDEKASEQSFMRAPAAKLGKITGRGDATGAVGADVAETAHADEKSTKEPAAISSASPSSSTSSVVHTFVRLWSRLWKLSHLEAAAESLATVGEACETAAVLAGGGMFWRAVGIQRLGLPFLSRRRRLGIERLGIVLSLCSVLLSLLVLRMERKALRSELRSAHRRIVRANDKLGWASDLAGTTIERDQALSYRKRDPSRLRVGRRASGSEAAAPLEMLGPDLQAAARDLDDQELNHSSSSSSSGSLSSSSSNLSDTWTVVPDGDDVHPHPTSRPIHSSHFDHHHHHHGDHHHHQQRNTHDGKVKPVNISSLIRSTERSLVRAESDLRKARRHLHLNLLQKVANWSESIFLGYEALAPQVDKDGIEGWTGLIASSIRLTALWKELSWS